LKNDPLPEILFLDSSFIISALINPVNGSPRKVKELDAAQTFVKRIIEEKKAVAFYTLAITAYWNIALLSELCRKYSYSDYRAFQSAKQKLKNSPSCLTDDIKERLDNHKKSFETIYESFEVCFKIESCYEIHSLAYKLIKKYHLESYDALHIASMQVGGENDFVSFDDDFKRCYDINLWCDCD